MLSDVGQARTNAAILLMLIATTSSRTCTKPIVGSRCILNGCLKCQSGFNKKKFKHAHLLDARQSNRFSNF